MLIQKQNTGHQTNYRLDCVDKGRTIKMNFFYADSLIINLQNLSVNNMSSRNVYVLVLNRYQES